MNNIGENKKMLNDGKKLDAMNKEKSAKDAETTKAGEINQSKIDAFNNEFGSEASDKKAMALGFDSPSPTSFKEQDLSSKYDEALKSVKDSKGADGVEQFQTAMITSSKSEHADHSYSAQTAMNNISKGIIKSGGGTDNPSLD